jgi:hypothetical protein
MKKLIIVCTLAISIIATAQLSPINNIDIHNPIISRLNNDLLIESLPSETIEEEDATFNFNTIDYLPLGFNPYINNNLFDIVEFNIEEEDAPFDFNTNDFLPIGFNPNKRGQMMDIVEFNIEEDASFDFDTNKYLPKGFDPYKGLNNSLISAL